jgi:hypothetical protein
MSTRVSQIAIFVVLMLVGCGGSERQSGEDPIEQFERDFGGPEGVMEFFAGHSASEIEEVSRPTTANGDSKAVRRQRLGGCSTTTIVRRHERQAENGIL